jgi:toxin ParE1/3/4
MRWSHQEFGEQAALRYDALITQAFADIRADPLRPGVQQRPELADGILVYHLGVSRGRARLYTGVVRRPRHFLVYRLRGRAIELLRVLHDARDIERHLPRENRL